MRADLTTGDLDFIRSLVRRHTGIALDETKGYLVSSRLLPVARDNGFESVGGLIASLRGHPFGALHTRALEALATTETSFFRDLHPFEALRTSVIPEFLEKRKATTRMLSIWCAACSSGQEPYSIAMILDQLVPARGKWTIQLLASDFSSAMIEKSQAGVYKQLEVNRGLPASLLVRYFDQEGMSWRIKETIRRRVTFFRHNLNDEWSRIPQLDLMFLRNVLIYFDLETRRRILAKVRRHLKPDGFLILGAAETTLNLDDQFRRIQVGGTAFYQPIEGGGG